MSRWTDAILFATKRFLTSLVLFFIACIVLVYGPRIGELEGYYFPVMKNFQIISRTRTEDGLIAIKIKVDKIRECNFVDQVWSIKTEDRIYSEQEMIEPKHQDPISVPKGTYVWDLVLATPFKYAHNPLRVVVHHRCWGNLFWTTETVELDESS